MVEGFRDSLEANARDGDLNITRGGGSFICMAFRQPVSSTGDYTKAGQRVC